MSILAEKKDATSADDLEAEAFREFLEEQDVKSSLPPNADMDRALEEHIERHGDLRFALSERSNAQPFAPSPGTEQAAAREPAKAPPVSELSPVTRKRARRARGRNLVQALNTAILLAFWALLVSAAARFVEVPLGYLLGAAFALPVVLLLVRRCGNARRERR